MSETYDPPKPPLHRPLIKHNSWSPDTVRDEAWLRRKSEFRGGFSHNRGKSVSDDDLEELKACIDLGFGFDPEDNDPKLTGTFPALGFYYAVNKQYANSLSRSSSLSSIVSDCVDGSPNSLIDPGDDAQKVKTKLKQWAQVVACAVRQSSL